LVRIIENFADNAFGSGMTSLCSVLEWMSKQALCISMCTFHGTADLIVRIACEVCSPDYGVEIIWRSCIFSKLGRLLFLRYNLYGTCLFSPC
jgi:hypothetical protein